MYRLRVAGWLLAGVSTLGIAQAAAAQTTPAPSATNNQDAAAPQDASAPQDAPAAATGGGDIVVTGSRTIRNGDNSPTPVTVIAKDTLQDVRPTSLTDSLNVMPVFSGSRGQTTNPGASGGVSSGNGNAAQLNLRNIGSTRTLVLMDGRRVPPTSFTNIVDADIVPQMLIERVDVVTGGVSAVYGSDAVSGVVNFITNKKFNGLKMQAQSGVSTYGDDPSQEIGIAAGTSLFGGRGHIEASYEYRNDSGLLRRSDRDWFNRPTVVGSVVGGGTAGSSANPWTLITNTTLANFPFGGRIIGCGTGCALTGQYFASNGVLSPFANGTATGSAGIQIGGAGGYFDNSLKSPQRMHQLYGRFDFDVTDKVKLFLVGSANFKRNEFYGNDLQLTNLVLTNANPLLPAAYRALIPGTTVNGVPGTFTFSQILNQAPRAGGIANTSQYVFTGGLEGKVGTFDWNVAYTHGIAKLKTTLLNNVDNQRLAAATDVVAGAGGQPVCYASTVNAAYSNCVPLNLFGPSAASAAAIDYILTDNHYVATTKQDDVTAEISGSPFDTWAGPVTVAFSGEYRKQSFTATSDATPSMYADCTNLRLNCVTRNVATGAGTFRYLNTIPATPLIKQSVWELAGEANLPLIKNVPLIQSFDLNGAVRYTKYTTVGSYWTWKLGADWHVTEDLRFRGTLSRDIRAPTLNDLFATTSVVIVNNQDLKTGASLPVPSVNLANPNLTAEIGKTWTVGAVFKPRFMPGFSLAIDYYNIRISGAITTVQGFQAPIQQGCYNQNIQLYCDLIIRNAAGQVTEWDVRPINLAEVKTYGIDVEANYNSKLFSRPLNLRLLAAYQPHIRYVQPGIPTLDQGGVGFGPTGLIASPRWRITGMASYKLTDNFRVDLLERWRDKLKLSGNPTDVFVAGQGTMPAYGETSVNLSWQVPKSALGSAEFFVNVQNIFNAKPPVGNQTNTGSGAGGFGGWAIGDDPIGRYYTAGFRVKF